MFRQYDEESEYLNALQPASVSAIIRRTAHLLHATSILHVRTDYSDRSNSIAMISSRALLHHHHHHIYLPYQKCTQNTEINESKGYQRSYSSLNWPPMGALTLRARFDMFSAAQ